MSSISHMMQLESHLSQVVELELATILQSTYMLVDRGGCTGDHLCHIKHTMINNDDNFKRVSKMIQKRFPETYFQLLI